MFGAPSTWTDAGPPEKMMPVGLRAAISSAGDVVGHDLGVDVRLADAPGDELGVLGAEVDDEDRVELVGHVRDGAARGLIWPTPSAQRGTTISSAFWNSLSVS